MKWLCLLTCHIALQLSCEGFIFSPACNGARPFRKALFASRLEKATSWANRQEPFVFQQVPLQPDLRDYVDIGNRLKNNFSSGAPSVERGINKFVGFVNESSERTEVAPFAYLGGSSGLGKTQLAFALKRRVLYIPLGDSQPIYRCFAGLYEVVKRAVKLDLAALREGDIKEYIEDCGQFSTTHLLEARAAVGIARYFTVSVLLKLLELFNVSLANAPIETNVFLGADCNISLKGMTVDEGRAAAEQYRDVLIQLDEVPPKDDLNTDAFEEGLFLRNIIRCMALPCLLSGTESSLLYAMKPVHGSRTAGRTRRTWLLTKFPATQTNVNFTNFSDYEKHLLSKTRPLFSNWFAECCGAVESPAPLERDTLSRNGMRMMPKVLSDMKHKICKAKMDSAPPGRHCDKPWLHASTLLVFAEADQQKQTMSGICSNVMDNSLLIRKHFAMMCLSPDLIDENGMTILYMEGHDLRTNDRKPFKVKSTFKSCAEDPLLYLACLRDGLVCRGLDAEQQGFVQVPSTSALTTFREKTGVRVGYKCAPSNQNGLETKCMAAMVFAAHSYSTFDGTPFFDWLARVVAELSAQEYYEKTEITSIPPELRAALKDVLVPLLSPPNSPWGEESRKSDINYGDLTWQGQGRGQVCLGRNYGYSSIDIEMIHQEDGFGGEQLRTVINRTANSSVTLLFGSTLSEWQSATTAKFDDEVSVFRMNAKGAIERVSPEVPVADWTPGRRVLIALDLERLHPAE